jgi:hypothetical protein
MAEGESIYKPYTGMFYKFVLKKTPDGVNGAVVLWECY